MVKDTKESVEVPEAGEQAKPKSPQAQEGQRSMQGFPEWTEQEDKLLADVQRLRAEQKRELQEDIKEYREEHEPWVQARREERLHAIVNAELAGEDEAQAE
jgi:hypothetical protein